MTRCLDTLNWAMELMPTGKAQAALTNMYNEMPTSSEKEEDELIAALCRTVMDGLLFGQWIGHTAEECSDMRKKRDARRAAKGE